MRLPKTAFSVSNGLIVGYYFDSAMILTSLFAIRGLPVCQSGHWGTQCVSQHPIPGWLLIMCRPLSGDCRAGPNPVPVSGLHEPLRAEADRWQGDCGSPHAWAHPQPSVGRHRRGPHNGNWEISRDSCGYRRGGGRMSGTWCGPCMHVGADSDELRCLAKQAGRPL